MNLNYFHPYELVSREVYETLGDKCLSLFDPAALRSLEALRLFLAVPLTVNDWHWGGKFQRRGFRTHAEQKAENPDAMKSAHIYGKAFDFDAQGIPADRVRSMIMASQDIPLLSEITRLEYNVNWIHFDIMPLPVGVPRIDLFHK